MDTRIQRERTLLPMAGQARRVELYLDLVFVPHRADRAPDRRRAREAQRVDRVGLFFVLWWTCGSRSTTTTARDYAAAAPAVPGRQRAGGGGRGRGRAGLDGRQHGVAISLAVTRLVLAWRTAQAGGRTQCCSCGSRGAARRRRCCSSSRPGCREPFKYVLWVIAIAIESGAMLSGTARPRDARATSTTGASWRQPTRPRRSTRTTSPSVRALPDHPARRGVRRGGPVVAARHIDVRWLDGAGRRRWCWPACCRWLVLRLRRESRTCASRAVGRLADDGARDFAVGQCAAFALLHAAPGSLLLRKTRPDRYGCACSGVGLYMGGTPVYPNGSRPRRRRRARAARACDVRVSPRV